MINNKIFKLILTDKENAKFNMQMDKILANSFKEDDLPILRLYSWKDSFTVGLSQKCEDYPLYIKEYKNNCAKRITGGGILFHGHDLSYSLILPSSYMDGLSVKQSYEQICQFLITFYKQLGLNACFAKDSKNVTLSKSEFCQVGFEAYDILVNDIKIGGNAQKRSKKMIFQHGSIPIKTTKKDIKIGSSLEDFSIHLSFDEARQKVIEAFKKAFNVKFEQSDLTKEQKEKLNLLLEDKK
ncbi:lipoate--protein ligase family protein [Arcobacter sp. CECT 8985]|uniref:lipoate--protein ligase family protein n=1 Tax=Arcobacter sp. CECT 8985 TaxID=1935424 RepID=UPI00100A24E5|nr:lipoate--protein ligase family protein [Arcobacter sp. CECT 8985]RXJ83598.1 ligase [Arcobacter sp. CECT 8985]